MNRRIISRKVGIIITFISLLLLLMTWIPTAFASSQKQVSVLVYNTALQSPTPIPQSTPTVDPTITALNKQQLKEQIVQLQLQNERSFSAWFWTSGASLLAAIIALAVGFLGFTQWRGTFTDQRNKDRKDRHADRQKREEDSFQKVVEELGSDKESAQVSGAIMLHTFLEPTYKRFFRQVFELAVAYLQFQRPNHDSTLWFQQSDTDAYKPPSPLSQALASVFKRSFPKVRDDLKKHDPQFEPKNLDARGIHLENADLYQADLEQVWLPYAFLHNAYLEKANLSGAQVGYADLTHANLTDADLSNADLTEAKLKGANPQDAKSLDGTIMINVEGLEKEQIEQCKSKGAIFEVVPDPSH